MARGRDLPEVLVPSGRAGARTLASHSPSSALHSAFLPLGHALQGLRRDLGSLGVLSARWLLPPPTAGWVPSAQRRSGSPGRSVGLA